MVLYAVFGLNWWAILDICAVFGPFFSLIFIHISICCLGVVFLCFYVFHFPSHFPFGFVFHIRVHVTPQQEETAEAEDGASKRGLVGNKDNYAKISAILKRLHALCVTGDGKGRVSVCARGGLVRTAVCHVTACNRRHHTRPISQLPGSLNTALSTYLHFSGSTTNHEQNQRLLRNLKAHTQVMELLHVPHEAGDDAMQDVLQVVAIPGLGGQFRVLSRLHKRIFIEASGQCSPPFSLLPRRLGTQAAHRLLQALCLNNPYNQRMLYAHLDFFLEDLSRCVLFVTNGIC
jgi:hypothetical protein